MPQSPDIEQNSDRGIFNFWISGQSLTKVNCHNSRTSDDIEMKLVPVAKLEKTNKQRQKNLTMTSCQQIFMSLPFFQFMANLEQSGRRNDKAFYLTETENRTKRSITQFLHYCSE